MVEPTSCCAVPGGRCARVDISFTISGVHLIDMARRGPDEQSGERLVLTVETHPGPVGCPGCGVLATGAGRRVRRLHDIPAFGVPVVLVWRSRRHRCPELRCAVEGVSEESELATTNAKLTTRAMWWAIGCLRTLQ